MIKTNDIDVFLLNQEFLSVFQELIIQFDKNKEKIYFNLINTFNNNTSLITILDPIALENLINKKISLDNYIFIIGNISNDITKKLDDEYINYELIETPINFFT